VTAQWAVHAQATELAPEVLISLEEEVTTGGQGIVLAEEVIREVRRYMVIQKGRCSGCDMVDPTWLGQIGSDQFFGNAYDHIF
jgi:hypothetical protein